MIGLDKTLAIRIIMMRARLSTCAMTLCLCVNALTGCEQPTPTPVDIQNNDTTDPRPIDFTEITGQNFADPSTSPDCPLTVTCAALPGESIETLSAGSCQESHFQVMEDGTRTFVDERTRAQLRGGRLTSLESDEGSWLITYSNNRITSATFEPALTSSENAFEQSFAYALSRLNGITTEQGRTTTEERTFTYDEEDRIATGFSKILLSDGSFMRTSSVYNYTGERTRERWLDLDVDGALSEPDELESAVSWREDGLLDTITTYEDGEPVTTRTHVYDDEGVITGVTVSSGDTTLATRAFTYGEDGLLQRIDFGEQNPSLRLTRDARAQLTLAQIVSANDRVLYEIELSGSSCDRTLNTWVNQVEEALLFFWLLFRS